MGYVKPLNTQSRTKGRGKACILSLSGGVCESDQNSIPIPYTVPHVASLVSCTGHQNLTRSLRYRDKYISTSRNNCLQATRRDKQRQTFISTFASSGSCYRQPSCLCILMRQCYFSPTVGIEGDSPSVSSRFTNVCRSV